MAQTIRDGHAHLIGLGRPAVLYPYFPRVLLSGRGVPDQLEFPELQSSFWMKILNTSLIGAGAGTAWHNALIWRLANQRWTGLAVPNGEQFRGGPLPQISAEQALWDIWRPWYIMRLLGVLLLPLVLLIIIVVVIQ